MLTNKKQALRSLCAAAVVVAALLTGCSPSGPDALLDGKRLIDRGQPARAVRKLREATALMPTNAAAWGYLGLAYQQGGSISNAVSAYSTALSLSPDSAEIRFNLGCAWMTRGEWAAAREQFAAATVLRRDFAGAWQRLGEAQVRLGENAAAVRSLGEALRLNAGSPDAWNWLGVAQLKQGRVPEARRSFESALRLQTNHGPALLNLAILNQTKLNKPGEALELYRQYLAFLPNARNANQVRRVAEQLEEGSRSAGTPTVVARTTPKTPAEPEPTDSAGLTGRKVVRTNPPVATEPARPSPVRSVVQRRPLKEPARGTVKVEPAPTIARSTRAPDPAPTATRAALPAPADAPIEPSARVSGEAARSAEDARSSRRGFFAKINPLNLFRKKPRGARPTPLPSRSESDGLDNSDPSARSSGPATPVTVDASRGFGRYKYRLVASPPRGDRRAAEAAFRKGEKLSKRGKEREALQAYLAAVEEDPSLFAAQFSLGLFYLDRRDPASALPPFESATKIQPESAAARYNFALALKAAGYPVDSANELLRLLAREPDSVRAHLALGNLYAQRFGDKAQARREYQRVLELSPGHPQASAIHLWLVQNPL